MDFQQGNWTPRQTDWDRKALKRVIALLLEIDTTMEKI